MTHDAVGAVDGFGVGAGVWAGVAVGAAVGVALGPVDALGSEVAGVDGEATATGDGLGAVVAHPASTSASSPGTTRRRCAR